MKLSQTEIVLLGTVVVYVAFFTHPPPEFVRSLLSSPWGHALSLLAVLFVSLKVSTLSGMFVGIAYLLSANPTLEYFEEPEKKDKKEKKEDKQPDSGAGKPDIKGALGKLMTMQGKDVTVPPPQVSQPKPGTPSKATEHFAAF
jgi:hypothetical protein